MTFTGGFKFFFLLFLVAAVSCVSSPRVFREKGLATGQQGMNVYTAKSPGETERLERPYTISPPLVPHNISEFNISRNTNDCLDCHFDGLEVEDGHIAVKVPPSHYINEYSKEQTEEQVAGIRYLCLQCHVLQSE